MPDYFYDMDLVVDPLNPSNVVANGSVAIYDPADPAGTTLLALKDPSGLPLPNPLTSNANGFLPPRIAQVPQTMWKSGGFTGYFNSYKGLRDEAVASVGQAQAAANAAASAAAEVVTTAAVNGSGKLILTKANGATQDAGSVIGPAGAPGAKGDKGLDGANVLPTQEAIAQAVTTDGPTKAALSATYATTAALANKADASALGSKLDKSARASRVFTLAGLGDSITDGTASNDDGDRNTDTTWLHLTHALSMGKIFPGGNFGLAGDRISQMLVRIPAVIAAAPTACLIMGGTNDVPQATTDAQLLAEVEKLFTEGHDVLAAAGIQPIVATIPPRGRSTAPVSADNVRRIAKVNALLKRRAQQRGYPLVDWHKVLVDPATGQYWDAANIVSDLGVHPNQVYCRKMAEVAVAAIAPMAGAYSADLATWNGDTTNLIPNALFMGATTNIGGYPMPAGWNGGTNNQRAITAPAPADGLLGNWFDVSKDATVAAATAGDVTALSPTIAAGASTFAVGDRMRFACRLRIEDFEGGVKSTAGNQLMTVTLYLSGSNTNRAPVWQWQSNIADALPVMDFTVPAGTTAMALQIAIYGQGKVRLGQPTLRNLTKLGII